MITAKDFDTLDVEVEEYMKNLLEEYIKADMGNRLEPEGFRGGGYGEDIYGQEGRDVSIDSQEAGPYGEPANWLQP